VLTHTDVADTFKHTIRTLVLPPIMGHGPSPRLGDLDLPPGVLPSDVVVNGGSDDDLQFLSDHGLDLPMMTTSESVAQITNPMSSPSSSVTIIGSSVTTPLSTNNSRRDSQSHIGNVIGGPGTPPSARPLLSPLATIVAANITTDRGSPRLTPLATPLLHTGRGSIVVPVGSAATTPHHGSNVHTPIGSNNGSALDALSLDFANHHHSHLTTSSSNNSMNGDGGSVSSSSSRSSYHHHNYNGGGPDDLSAYTDPDGRRWRPRAGMPMLPPSGSSSSIMNGGTDSGRGTPEQHDDDHRPLPIRKAVSNI
jgi:hypothetical protein